MHGALSQKIHKNIHKCHCENLKFYGYSSVHETFTHVLLVSEYQERKEKEKGKI
jgi:hypothetical protein